jgi:hypothetical protein
MNDDLGVYGSWRAVRKLGEGGQGRVFLAEKVRSGTDLESIREALPPP